MFEKSMRKCPYFILLILSGIYIYLYAGFTSFCKTGDFSEQSDGNEIQTVEGTEYAEDRLDDDAVIAKPVDNTQESVVIEDADAVKVNKDDNTIIKEDNSVKRQEDTEGNREDAEKEKIVGITRFIYYDAQYVSSPYYSDPGKIALTTEYPYETVEDDYFSDAAFIGDSRTLGLYDYSGLTETDFYCDNGFCTYLWQKKKEVKYQNTNKNVLLDEAMDEKAYGKIYIMLGMNDCGYGNIDDFRERYQAMLDMLHSKHPDAVIYLMANLHMSKSKSDSDKVYNNVDINAHNVAIAELADGETYFYLDANDRFGDGNGNLRAELTFDGAHLYADGYIQWMDFIKQHAVVR